MNAKSVRARESTMLRKKMLRPQLSDLRHLVDSSDEDEDADVQTTIEVAGTIHRHLNQLFTPEGAAANEDTQQLWSDIKALRGTDAKAVVQFLDKKVEQMNTQDRASYCASLRLLRRLCAENQIYPKSVTLPPRRLQILSDQAEAFGGSSRVYQGQYDNTHVAVKVIATSRESQFDTSVVKRFFREAVIWRHLRHRNITAFYGVDTSVFSLCLVSEWMPLGTVSQFLTSRPRTNRTKLLQDVAHGLAYLHALDIVHADVKSANVLVDDQHNAKLIDSGIATISTHMDIGNCIHSNNCYDWNHPLGCIRSIRPGARWSRGEHFYSRMRYIFSVDDNVGGVHRASTVPPVQQ
ncbi:hypothetical protein CERSUDRAFT_88608 [Gelatoporia subvermispora B]|uniref:Protein kinase domain-containing protein n=1 Tax=Ceriporiopsis subvermispora (strain B) TaxID=914234 RepID=M2P9A7_CERS8|nr:hypothetical protein CERSUDRAFT_88608 [Gelatoporia subvermispora B]